MELRFIFMLTRNDKTVEDAEQHLEAALAEGIRHIGFKDVGLPIGRLQTLNQRVKDSGATSYLEVVSLDKESEVRSAKVAIEIGVDILMGGTNASAVLPLLEETSLQYYPFPGNIIGHPSVLEGSIAEIVAGAKRLAALEGVHGLDLLAYRSTGDVKSLMTSVCEAVDKPVIIAGSIHNKGRIAEVQAAGSSAFTIGTAALDGNYPATGKDIRSQLRAITRDVAEINNHTRQLQGEFHLTTG
ncbi:hypothetical protein [Epibacterium ulvae]|uniref:hypothetical protein n=1 Tax=Epibacterium ulvae TaxID=1156985 RepID=UPI0024910F58|nr:hypothetical protein [Epibacterium ulvae]